MGEKGRERGQLKESNQKTLALFNGSEPEASYDGNCHTFLNDDFVSEWPFFRRAPSRDYNYFSDVHAALL